MTIDLYNDPGHVRLDRLMTNYPKIKEFLKEAQFEENNMDIPKTAFAWEEKRLFPLHTPEHAILSFLYSKEAEELPQEVKKQIDDALKIYNIKIAELIEIPLTKIAEENPDNFLFPEQKTYPIRTALEIKIAEEKLLDQQTKLKPLTKVALFKRLFNAANKLNVTLKTASLQFAGKTEVDKNILISQMQNRTVLVKNAEDNTKLNTLIEAIKTSKDLNKDPELKAKLAEEIHKIDLKNNLESQYNKRILDPISSVFSGTKIAMSGDCLELNGNKVYYSDMVGLPPSFFGDCLGEDFMKEVSLGNSVDPMKLKTVVDTLPADMKLNLINCLKSTGLVRNA